MSDWKNRFEEYTTSSAFRLDLSRIQCRFLAVLSEIDKADKKGWEILHTREFHFASMTSLERKGLISHDGDRYHLTKAGKLALQLVLLVFPKKELMKPHDVVCIREIPA